MSRYYSKSNFYLFTNFLNDILKKNLLKFIGVNVICKDLNNNLDLKNLLEIKKFCKKNNIKFYIADNYKLAVKLKSNGLFISSWNKKNYLKYKPEFKFIGSAHNQLDIYYKKRQKCDFIVISPIFYNSKYSKNSILKPIKFNILLKFCDIKIIALGGINDKTFKKILLTKSVAVGFFSWINDLEIKKPVHFLNVRALN
jgi:thiamine-phosphate pyrophosphorylase